MLFDKDGTLCRSDSYLSALAQARAHFCVELCGDPSLEAPLLAAYGLGLDGELNPAGATAVANRYENLISTATLLAAAGFSWSQARQWAAAALEAADQTLAADKARLTPPTPGLIAMLEQLEAAGVTLAIISGDLEPSLEAFLHYYGLRKHFRALHGSNRVPAKPDPAAVFNLCAELRIAPARCGLIGDAADDLAMASAAGLGWSLAYSGGWRSPPQLQGSLGQLQHWDQLLAG